MHEAIKLQIRALLTDIQRNGLKWKLGSDMIHLERRKKRKHIPQDWSLRDYTNQIMNILNDKENEIHLYYKEIFEQRFFVFGDGHSWIVIIGENGVMETAMIAERYHLYVSPEKGYMYLGKIKEVWS